MRKRMFLPLCLFLTCQTFSQQASTAPAVARKGHRAERQISKSEAFDLSTPSAWQYAIGAAERLLQTHVQNLAVPGMQVSVASHGKTIWSGSFGYANLAAKVPVSQDTSFRIGSISKSLTAAGVGLLVQKHLLDLDAPVRRYVPSFPEKRWAITVRQIAGHLGGIRHYRSEGEVNSNKHYSSVLESLAPFKDDPLLFEPGTQFAYSSYGYVLLSAVVEAAAKEPFTEFMSTQVFEPLGMKHTTMDYSDRAVSSRSTFYILNDKDERIEAPPVDSSNKWGAGGMLSTAGDLVRFGNAMLRNQLLDAATTELLLTSMNTRDGKETGYGIGWEIRHDPKGRRVIVNDGSLPSARAVLAIYPDHQLVIAVLANTGTGIFFNREEAFMLADLFLDPHGLAPTPRQRRDVAGEYTYSAFIDKDSVTGKINLVDSGDSVTGTMTIPNRFFKDRVIPVPVVRVKDSEVSLIGTPGNWISIDLEKRDDSFTGRWNFGPLSGTMHGVRHALQRPDRGHR